MNDYEQQAIDFLESTGTKLELLHIAYDKYFYDDKERRDIYKFTLTRGKRSYTARFGQSIANTGQVPSAYDVLACLGSYYPDDFKDFCDEFGYEVDQYEDRAKYKAVKAIHKACLREQSGMNMLFSEQELEQLAEIN